MRARFPQLTRHWLVVIAGGAMIIGTTARGQLPRRSPFQPENGSTVSASNDLPLEYVGYIRTARGLEFRLRDRPGKSAAFLRLNERAPDFDAVPRSFDPESGALTVEHLGRTFTLAVPKAKVRSALPMPAPHVPPGPRDHAYVAPAVIQSVKLNPTPADDDVRLKAVATEIARRREERAKAATAK